MHLPVTSSSAIWIAGFRVSLLIFADCTMRADCIVEHNKICCDNIWCVLQVQDALHFVSTYLRLMLAEVCVYYANYML